MVVTLHSGRAIVEVWPETGGTIARFAWESDGRCREWLRGATNDASGRGEDCGCFPLVPFSNRVRDGRFAFKGREVQLPVDASTGKHFEHGHGWRRPWAVVSRGPSRVEIRYEHAADAWPWSYRAEQEIAIVDDGLHCRISITNLSPEVMPMGLGLHPYFPVSPRSRLTAGVARSWLADDEILPLRLVEIDAEADPRRGLALASVDLDTVFTGWQHAARIDWPEWNASLDIRAQAPLDFLVIYVPPGKGYCCVEPVSNMTDAFNFAAAGHDGTGSIELAPGATVAATVQFVPSLLFDRRRGNAS